MFKRLKHAFSAGGIEVDTVITSETILPGGTLEGVVKISGGAEDVRVDGVRLEVQGFAETETDEGEHAGVYVVAGSHHELGTVAAERTVEIPFVIDLPIDLPPVDLDEQGLSRLALATIVDIPGAKDATDHDPIGVDSLPGQLAIFEAIEAIGYEPYSYDFEVGELRGDRLRGSLPFYAEYEYRGRGRVREVELSFITTETEMEVVIEADRSSWHGSHDSIHRFPFDPRSTDVDAAVAKLSSILD